MKNPKLLQMLSYKRPAGSQTELSFIKRYILPFKPQLLSSNYIVVVPGDETTLFSCHTDTVHRDGGSQLVLYDENLEIAYKDDKEPLGADDTAGVWLMLEMLKAKIPGTYAFHYGEEKGCIGSKQMLREHPAFLSKFKRAIAFDRRGTTSVITHQHNQRCCSDAFGKALAAELGNDYKLDPTGLYTDTASYMSVIPECTNISVGYEHQHCKDEHQDCSHLALLQKVVMDVKWSTLPVERDPKAKPHYRSTYEGQNSYQGSYQNGSGSYYTNHTKYNAARGKLATLSEQEMDDDKVEEIVKLATEEIDSVWDAAGLVRQEPALAGRMLFAFILQEQTMQIRRAIRMTQGERVAHAANDPVRTAPLPFPIVRKEAQSELPVE